MRADPPSARPELSAMLVVDFPRGLPPRRCTEPARQLPVPQPFAEPRPGLCCPAADHPQHGRLADPIAMVLSGAAQRVPLAGTPVHSSGALAGYDPLGGMHERELERRLVVRRPSEQLPGEYAWPPCELHPEGAADSDLRMPVMLAPGTRLELLGSPHGRVLAAAGTSFAQRSLPEEYAERTLSRLTVQFDLPAWQVQTAAWFGQPGGGTRYRLSHSVAELLAMAALAVEEPGE